MNMEIILANIKEELKCRIEGLTFENVQNEKAEIDKHFNLLLAASEVTFLTTSPDTSKEETKTETILPIEREETILSGSKVGKVYEFKRHIRGGVILDLDGGYFVPERMVRDMGVNHGDKVKITHEIPDEEKMKYRFEVVEKVNKIVPNRTELKYCRVENDPYIGFYIEKSQDGPIRLDEALFRFIIREDDVTKFNLAEGDIVDAAYSNIDPTKTFRLLYKYKLEEEEVASTVESRKLASADRFQKKAVTDQTEKDFPFDEALFKGKRVLIIGAGHRKHDFKDIFERIGAEFVALTGDESRTTIESSIQWADVVGINYGENSHYASTTTVDLCKKHGVPFKSTGTIGLQSMVLCVEEAIKKKMDETVSHS